MGNIDLSTGFSEVKFSFPILSLFQNSMDLPPDKERVLKNYDDDKKWELICDQVSYVFIVFEWNMF